MDGTHRKNLVGVSRQQKKKNNLEARNDHPL